MKAIRKDRTRRYRSASELADDIQNYLTGTPLIAGPESAVYRAKKFMRKHAGSVTTGALVSLAIILGLVVSIVFGQRAEQARQEEVIARKQVEAALARAEKAERMAQEQRKLAEERAETYRRTVYANNLAMAKEAIDKGDFRRAQKLLSACESDLRGWEWQHLDYMSADPCIKTLRGHEDCVYAIALSPDGRRIASGSGDETVKIWDAATGSELMTLRGLRDDIESVAFSPDGKRVASCCDAGFTMIWDIESGAEVRTLRGHRGVIGSVAFSPDGKHLASSGARDSTIRVWEIESGTEVMTLRGHKRDIWAVAYSPDGEFIVSGSFDNTVKMWDAETGAEIRTLTGHDAAVWSVVFSPDGKRIASAGGDKTIKIWDAATGAEMKTLTGHDAAVVSVVFSPDGKRIASCGRDRTIRIWNANTGDEERSLRGYTRGVGSVVFSLDGKQIITGCHDCTIKIWNPAIHQEVLRFYRGTEIRQVAFSPDGKRIAACNESRRIILIDALSGVDILSLGAEAGWMGQPIAFSPDGSQTVSSDVNRNIKVWNASTGALEMTLTGHTGRVLSVAFRPDGRHIVSGSRDETIKVWNAVTGTLEKTLTGHKDHVRSVTFSPDGTRIISGSRDGTIRIWDALSGTELLTLHSQESLVGDVSISTDGKRIASCGDRTVRIWDATTGEELMTLRGHESGVGTVAFSPDGRRIVSGGGRGEIKIWDAGTGMELIDLYEDPTSVIRSVVFSPDGKSICVGSYAGGIILLESVEPEIGDEARRIANSANSLVDKLYERHDLYGDVISKLRDDDTFVEPVRSKALQMANARLWQDAMKLDRESWLAIFSTDLKDVEYREALEKLEKVVRLDPNNYSYLAHLGVAQYRVGAYENALATLARAKKMRDDADREKPAPIIDGFRAMTLYQLGRGTQANVVLRELRSGFERWFSTYLWYQNWRVVALSCVFEVERFFAGQDRTLLSIWELIEDHKLDEASELIEKARLSKNADYANRMEGAIKLIEVLRKRK